MINLIKNFTKKELIAILFTLLLVATSVFFELKIPDYMSSITVLIKTSGIVKDIIKEGTKMLLCALGSLASSIITGYIIAFISSSFSKNIRLKVFNKVQDFSMNEIKKFQTSSLITRTTNDITQVQRFLAMGMEIFFRAPITAVWAICKISGKNSQWSLITLIAVILLLSVISTVIVLTMPKSKKLQTLTDNLNRIERENMTGIKVIKAFNAEKFEEEKFSKANDELTNTNLYINRLMAILSPGMNFLLSMVTLAIYFSGAFLINKATFGDKITLFSNMVVFSSYAIQVIISFMMMVITLVILPRTLVAFKRINEVLNEEIIIKSGKIKKNDLPTKIEFNNVSFKYPDAEEYILEDISFEINEGETIAFIGGTGSGKSTLVSLLPRFYDVTKGEILINGINIKNYDLEYLYKIIGYIPQKAVIFSGSVKDNIAYGDNDKIKKDSIKKALKIAQADFVDKMEEKEESILASRGTNISGGQKQRIAIARAIARNPKIYIFDDTFSALDYKTDYKLRKDLKKYTKNATTLIVAQRIGTIMNADKIVVLDKGKIVGIGNHTELLKTCKLYKDIALSQLNKEELE